MGIKTSSFFALFLWLGATAEAAQSADFCYPLKNILRDAAIAAPQDERDPLSDTRPEEAHEAVSKDRSAGYQLSAEIEAIIEKYQDPAFIEKTMRESAKFADPDFIHRILHPRESGFEHIDTLNKKVLYRFPYFMRTGGKTIGICGCDIIGLASHFVQKYFDKAGMKVCMNNLIKTMALAAAQQCDVLIPLLDAKDANQVVSMLINTAWLPAHSTPLLRAYLKQRLAAACLEYIKKGVTPPSFFIHGKTKEGQETDRDTAHIAPITSVIPVLAIDGVVDPILNSNMLTSNEHFDWYDPYGNRANILFNINAQYALEGAKQLDWIGSLDEELLFTLGKEMAISLLFLHRELKAVTQKTLLRILLVYGNQLKTLLSQHSALQKDSKLTPDDRMAREKESIETLELFFKTTLGKHGGDFLSSLRQAQCIYNIACTGALLAPVAYKSIKFAWKFINALNKPVNGETI